MVEQLFVRMTGGLGLLTLAIFFVGLVPFLSADPSSGAAFKTPAFSVNREFKGDQLPVSSDLKAALLRNAFESQRSPESQEIPQEIPDGCDAAFSPISAPRLAHIYGRCTA
jgi:hypothetical protein